MSEIGNEKNLEIKEGKNQQNQHITIKKSTFKSLVALAIVATAASTFFAGYIIGTTESADNSVSSEDFETLLAAMKENQESPNPQPAAQQNPTQNRISSVSLDDDPIKGSKDAPITIVEFSDFQCPFCSRFYQQTLPLLDETYIEAGKVKLVYRDFPLTNIHQNAMSAHVGSECADEQGRFWDYHDILFDKQAEWNRLPATQLNSKLVEFATELELNKENFSSCLESSEIRSEVGKDLTEASTYGATGTPTFFIGNDKVGFIKLTGAQPFDTFQSVIDSLLAS